jgi:TonB family protein
MATDVVDDVELIKVDESELGEYWVEWRTPAAVYPGYERRKGTEGCVRMGIIIEPNGRVEFVEVLWSVPPAVFERPAQSAMRRYRYKPAEETAPALPVYTTHTMTFYPGEAPQTLGDLADLCLPPEHSE